MLKRMSSVEWSDVLPAGGWTPVGLASAVRTYRDDKAPKVKALKTLVKQAFEPVQPLFFQGGIICLSKGKASWYAQAVPLVYELLHWLDDVSAWTGGTLRAAIENRQRSDIFDMSVKDHLTAFDLVVFGYEKNDARVEDAVREALLSRYGTLTSVLVGSGGYMDAAELLRMSFDPANIFRWTGTSFEARAVLDDEDLDALSTESLSGEDGKTW
jgi:hypothetical protein